MPRPTRSRKKTNPEFDPSELSDLIYTPAVGSGVASHLLEREPNKTTVVRSDSDMSTVDMFKFTSTDLPTVVKSNTKQDNEEDRLESLDLTTVVDSTTVVKSESDSPTVDMSKSDSTTVVMSKAAWVSEDGDPIAVGRVQRIRLAQDALSPTEEAVYNLLWGSQPGKDDVASRSVQAGYDFIMKRTRLSKKTVQRVIDKLAGKGFLEIEIPPDIYRRISTIYRVYSYRTILDRQAEKGRYYVARIGPGVVYARQREETGQTDMTTVDKSEGELDPTTVVNLTTPTVVKLTPVTVVRKNLTTVVKMTTLNLEQSTIEDFGKGREGEDSSSSLETVVRSLGFFGSVDDDAAIRLIGQCRENAPDCTVEEIVWFIHEKGQLTRPANNRIYNPIGFLLTAVPKCFVGENLQLFRQEQARLRAEQERRELETQEELAAFQAENERILNDPGVTEEERQWARRMLGLDRSPDQE